LFNRFFEIGGMNLTLVLNNTASALKISKLISGGQLHGDHRGNAHVDGEHRMQGGPEQLGG
jgi:hypothetical protein